MIRVLGLCLTLAAGPAAALSCLAPDVANSYRQAAEADEAYVVLWGDFAFTPGPLPPQGDDPNAPVPPAPVVADFTGKSLTRSGFTRDVAGPVTLEPVCWAAWCGGFPEPGAALVFALSEADGYRVALDPCGTTAFARPTAKDIARVEACHGGGACEALQ